MAVRVIGELRWVATFLEPRQPHKRTASGLVREEFREWRSNVPAKVEQAEGTESPGHASRDSTNAFLVTIRDDLPRKPTTTDVIELPDHGGRLLNITSVRDFEFRGRWLELICRESA
jgi:head-tail adaptor